MIGQIIGEIPATIQHPAQYFHERGCFVDCRGDVRIDATAMFGYEVKILSASHDIHEGLGPQVDRRVWIDQGAWIASFSILCGCWIQHDAVVAAGSVVNGVIVPSYSMVQGNPARVVASYDLGTKRWIRLPVHLDLERWPDRRV